MQEVKEAQEAQERLFVFKITEEENGIKVDFESIDPDGNAAEDAVTTVDLSMIVISLVTLLKDQGLNNSELKEFMGNIVDEVGATIEGDVGGQEEQEQDEDQA